MISDEDDGRGWILGVVFGVVALVIALAIGVSMHFKNVKNAGAAASANATASSSTTGAVTGAAAGAAVAGAVGTADAAAGAANSAVATDAASVKVENGVVKFYFASGKSEIAAGGKEALAEVVKAVGAGKKAVVSGFHDATGDKAKNEELSKLRAFAVRDALKGLGVAEDKIELKKPEDMLATGSNAEARRVEVSIK
ncbi:MAG: OmpA family protein [Polaromonas sp.]|jgi:outer membrane protein OmpA-like peptidoglycan-associated protein|nr:OmpA family protein [Polaromonas sp.]MBP6156118.1 OmpA family protein [Polaromonas sp.]MBP7116328.1 OmpA family protein [Polaromonas sp.]MBP7308539.1 OmpA family protein [Polaromonas sp.]MBP8873456.1 OmpA family protein [Polaromonas sp.]